MVAIPQVFRDKIASSVVGTAGVDPSAQAIGQGISGGANEVATAGFNIATEKQNLRNEGEYASLMVQHSQNIMAATENIKQQYSANPDGMVPALSKAIDDSLNSVSQKASNPFVKLMVQRGDPAAQGWALRQTNEYAFKQGYKNTLAHASSTLNDLTNQSQKIGSDLDMSPEDMVKNMSPLAHVMGQLHTSIANSAHSDLADEVSNKGMMSIMKGLLDKTIETQPVKTAALLQNPEVTKYFTPDQIKKYQTDTDAAIKEFPKKMMTQQIQNDLSTQPGYVNNVMQGKMGYADIDRLQRMDQSGLHDSTYNYLKDIALGTGPGANKDKQELKAQFVDEAARLGFKMKGDPSDLTRLDVEADKKAIMSANVKDLYKLQDDLLDARRRNIISTEEFNQYYNKLYTPLVAATMKNHDPSWWDKLVHDPHNPNYGKNEMPGQVDDFKGAYHVIENFLSFAGVKGAQSSFSGKAAIYDQYFKAIDKNKGQMMPNTNNPWTPRETAYSVLGIGTGMVYNFPGFGNRVISGHDEDGTPTFNSTKEDDERLANMKNLKALQKQGKP